MKLIVAVAFAFLAVCSAKSTFTNLDEPLNFELGLYSEKVMMRPRGNEIVHKYIGYPTTLTNDIVQIVDILYHNLTPYPVEIQNFENIESEKYRYWVLHSQRGRGIDGIVTLTYQSKPIENAFEAGLPHFSKHVVVPSGIVSQKVYIENPLKFEINTIRVSYSAYPGDQIKFKVVEGGTGSIYATILIESLRHDETNVTFRFQ